MIYSKDGMKNGYQHKKLNFFLRPVWGVRFWKTLTVSHWFSSIFNNSRKNDGQAPWQCLDVCYVCSMAPQLLITPMRQASTCDRVWSQGDSNFYLQVLQTSGSLMFMFRVKPCQREIATDKFQEGKYHRECNVKNTRVSALTGSVSRKMADGQLRVSTQCENWSQAASLTRLSLTAKAWVNINLKKKQ